MKKILVALTILAGAAASTQAGLILSDSFTYANGPLTTVSGGAWQLHSGTALSMIVTNGMLCVSRLRSEDDNAALAGAPYLRNGGATLYSSFTIVISNDMPTIAGTYFAHFKGTNTGAATDFGARVFATQSNTVSHAIMAGDKYRISIGNGSSATNNDLFGQVDLDLSTNVVYKVVTRFVPLTGISTVWVNPTSETGGATAQDVANANTITNAFNVYQYAFRQASGEGTIFVDDLKVGTNFNELVGAPSIDPIGTQNTPMNTPAGPIPFTVQDDQTVASSLTVTATSDTPSVVPNSPANLTLTMDTGGTNRTITVTPANNVQGSANITVSVSDGTYTSLSSFLVRVGAPIFGRAIANVIAYTNTPVPPVPFTVIDYENDPITFSVSSGNTNVLKNTGIVIASQGGGNYTATLTPEAGVMGWAKVTINASDTYTTNTTSFVLTEAPKLGVMFADNFAYTEWLFTPQSLDGATGSPWVKGGSSGGTDFQMQVTNGWVYLVSTNSEDCAATITNKFPSAAYNDAYETTNAVVFYSTFKVNASELGAYSGDYFYHLKTANTVTSGYEDKIYARTNGAAPGKYRLAVANFSTLSSATFPMDLDLNTEYTVVTRYNSATGEAVLWVNPFSELSRCATAVDIPSPSAVGSVTLRQPSQPDYGALTLGALKIGTSWSDVHTTTAPGLSPIRLYINMAGGKAVLTWNMAGANVDFVLQSAITASGTYITIPNAYSPYSVTPGTVPQFFRLIAQ